MDDRYNTTTGAKIDPWKRIADLQAALAAAEQRIADLLMGLDAANNRWLLEKQFSEALDKRALDCVAINERQAEKFAACQQENAQLKHDLALHISIASQECSARVECQAERDRHQTHAALAGAQLKDALAHLDALKLLRAQDREGWQEGIAMWRQSAEQAAAEVEAHEAVRDACFDALGPECQVWGDVPGHIEALRAELAEAKRRKVEPDPFRLAVHAFVDKLEAIHNDPTYKSVWMINQMHSGQYTGPTYTAELAALKKALEPLDAALSAPTGEGT